MGYTRAGPRLNLSNGLWFVYLVEDTALSLIERLNVAQMNISSSSADELEEVWTAISVYQD